MSKIRGCIFAIHTEMTVEHLNAYFELINANAAEKNLEIQSAEGSFHTVQPVMN